MHELALTQSVVDMILERTVDRQVSTVRLRVGLLSGVVPDAMRFCYDLVTAGTGLQGSTLEIEQPPGRAHCRTCGKTSSCSTSSCSARAAVRTCICSAGRSWTSSRWNWSGTHVSDLWLRRSERRSGAHRA